MSCQRCNLFKCVKKTTTMMMEKQSNDATIIKHDYVTLRKHLLPKSDNQDLLLSETMEEVNLEDGSDCKDLLADENPNICSKFPIHIESDNTVQDSGIKKKTKKQCRANPNAGNTENVLKVKVKGNEQKGAADSSLKNVTKDKAVEKERRETKAVSFISKQDEKYNDEDSKLEVERNKENVTGVNVCYSNESSEKSKEKCNERKKFSPIQPRRNPHRRAKEGISYRL